MERFLLRHKDRMAGSISGFDRMRFQGTLRWKSKEDIAMKMAERDGIKEGLIGVRSCVEPCQSFDIQKDKKAKQLKLVGRWRKCLHLYFYWLDREYGLMHLRLQTWAPFTIQVCVNGREWLARQMDREGIGYEKHDNCFTRIDNLERAQQLFDLLDQQAWAGWLEKLAASIHPFRRGKSALHFKPYYWSLAQGEYATDILFRDPWVLKEIYPALLQHAIHHFQCKDVLRFLGRRISGLFNGEVRSHMGSRVEGVRIKHWVEENSIKMYDKAGSVLRIETTINNTTRFKVRRRVTRQGQKKQTWVKMRKGVVDIRRRVEVCRGANARYLDALAVVGDSTPSHRVLDPSVSPSSPTNAASALYDRSAPPTANSFSKSSPARIFFKAFATEICGARSFHEMSPTPTNAAALPAALVAVFNCCALINCSTESPKPTTTGPQKKAKRS